MNTSHLDISKLEKIRYIGNDVISACPACRENDKDSNRDNLRIFSSGAFNCIAHPKEREHNQRIFQLVGVLGERSPDPTEQREWKQRRAREHQRERDEAAILNAARKHREAIINRYHWEPDDVWEDSPQRIDCPLVESDPRHFLSSLFPEDAILWTGQVHESGKLTHRSQWKSCAEWQQTHEPIGPMTTPAIWLPGIHSRSAGNILSSPYTVLDFDGFDGVKPATHDDLKRHISASLALIRWLREGMDWQLAAMLFTGSKSIHAWFHTPSSETLASLQTAAPALGIDAGLIARPEHPCRLPGWKHEKTGRPSHILWLQTPIP
jgi:hypothetical protein